MNPLSNEDGILPEAEAFCYRMRFGESPVTGRPVDRVLVGPINSVEYFRIPEQLRICFADNSMALIWPVRRGRFMAKVLDEEEADR